MTTAAKLLLLMNQHDASQWPQQRFDLRRHIARVACRLWDEVDALEDTMSDKRDWFDAHRRDDPPHAKWQTRWDTFLAGEVTRHMEWLQLLERALPIVCLNEPVTVYDLGVEERLRQVAEEEAA